MPELLLGHHTLRFFFHNFLQLEYSVDMLGSLLRYCTLKHSQSDAPPALRQALVSGNREALQAAVSTTTPQLLDRLLPPGQTRCAPLASVKAVFPCRLCVEKQSFWRCGDALCAARVMASPDERRARGSTTGSLDRLLATPAPAAARRADSAHILHFSEDSSCLRGV